MDNLNVFKKMGRYVTAQINALSQTMQATEQSGRAAMGLENRLVVEAWNTLADHDGSISASA
jgi:hypothetical protein